MNATDKIKQETKREGVGRSFLLYSVQTCGFKALVYLKVLFKAADRDS